MMIAGDVVVGQTFRSLSHGHVDHGRRNLKSVSCNRTTVRAGLPSSFTSGCMAKVFVSEGNV